MTPPTFLEETMREFDQKFPHNANGEITCKAHGGIAVTSEIKDFISSSLTLQRKQMREMLEKMKVPEGDLMELTGVKMNENSIRHLVRTSCDMRQNIVLEDIINALGE